MTQFYLKLDFILEMVFFKGESWLINSSSKESRLDSKLNSLLIVGEFSVSTFSLRVVAGPRNELFFGLLI